MAIDKTQGAAYTDIQALAQLRSDAKNNASGTAVAAAKQFEALFTRMMLSSMRQASQGDSIFDSQAGSSYRDMFDDQLSVELSKGHGLGLADMLIQQLARAGVPGADATGADPAATPAATSPGTPATTSLATPAKTQAAANVATAPVSRAERASFIEKLLPDAEAAGRTLGVSPRTLIAQAALETGWGRSVPTGANGQSSFNLFGVKAAGGAGAAVAASTTEYDNGVASTRVERFRAYGSASDSFRDHAALLAGNPRYSAALGTGDDAATYAAAMQRGGYATDPQYARKLTDVAQQVGNLLDAGLKGGNPLPIQVQST
jgi:flagellar protein FlgJ